MATTLKEMRDSINLWNREPAEDRLVNEAVNSAINEIWQEAALFSITNFLRTREVTIEAGAHGAFVVSVPNPTEPPIVIIDGTGTGGIAQRFQFTWVSVFGGETEPSPAVEVVGSLITSVSLPANVVIPQYAERWNLYRDGKLVTPSPLGFTSTWAEEDYQQPPNPRGIPAKNTTSDEIMWVEGAYVTLPNGTLQRWTNAEIGSVVWSRAEHMKAHDSQWFSYVWNMASGNFIAIMPPAARELTPDLLYIRRPVKLINDGDIIPFPAFDAVPFIRAAALSLISKSLHEWNQAAEWNAQAEKEKRLILQLQIRQNRQEYVTPYRTVSHRWI